MLSYIAKKVFGSANERIIKSLQPIVDRINSLEKEYEKLSDSDLKSCTQKFKDRLEGGEKLDDILPEAFAVVREASKRTLGMRHFDVQLIGGIILHRGMISEMKTGEGKTLVATLPVYLNALSGKGVHVVTVNDYLAKRDSEWMGEIYKFLGLTVGCLINDLKEEDRKGQYEADITYGTNNEFGFDYLRDNLKFELDAMVQREYNFAIVDEVDSILIDESRTPLIISGPTEDNTDLYTKIDKFIPQLAQDDFEVDEKSKSAVLTDQGNLSVEELLKKAKMIADDSGLFDYDNMTVVHHVNQSLKAHKVFQKDVDYIVKENKVMIIDEFTGRIMDGRRYSDGLHQALEAKERVHIQNENQTLAAVTFQNYFRMYPKLAGMTGTAMTEASEFADIYGLEAVEIPTNVPVTRIDEDDEIYRTAKEKYDAIVEEIKEAHEKGQPVLVGTISIEKSELLSSILKKNKIKHNVLNARHHAKEAEIIAQAGQPGAVTIATNMAGRGTDIKLGGNAEMLAHGDSKKVQQIEAKIEEDKKKVIEAGGLFVLATERHESRRIDNQLRGRSGRQGDPGRTKFYLSLEDDLMRIFGSEKISGMLEKLGLKDGEAIVHPWISKSLEKAQQKVEARNYDIRKTLLKFDNVMNDQRKVIYEQRIDIMKPGSLEETVLGMAEEIAEELIAAHIPQKSLPEEWDTEGLEKELFRVYGIHLPVVEWAAREGIADEEITGFVKEEIQRHFKDKHKQYGEEMMEMAERQILLMTLDQLWKEHLHTLDHLRTGINLRAYAQKDPLNEYKIEAFNLFKKLLDDVAELTTQRISHLEISSEIEERHREQKMFESRNDPTMVSKEDVEAATPQLRPVRAKIAAEDRDPNDPSTWGKVSRNDECPCGSGKKYKQCHGKI